MLLHQSRQIQPGNFAINHSPVTADHDTVGAVGPTQDQRCQRIARTRKTRFVQLEEGEIRLLAHGNPSDIATPKTSGRTRGRPTQNILMADLPCAIPKPLNL